MVQSIDLTDLISVKKILSETNLIPEDSRLMKLYKFGKSILRPNSAGDASE